MPQPSRWTRSRCRKDWEQQVLAEWMAVGAVTRGVKAMPRLSRNESFYPAAGEKAEG
ncbi:MAG: hypothetical protein ACLT9S_00115 [Faecalibacterium sp.]